MLAWTIAISQKLRKAPFEDRLLALCLLVFASIAFVRAWAFYWFHGLPGLYAKDLGINFIVSEYIRHTIHSPRDFFDMLGWNIWWDQPLFSFNGYTSYLGIVPVADLLQSTWASIKFWEITQSVFAFFGTFALLRLFGRPRIWAAAAAFTYASIPAVILMPRGNLDLGWPTVLAPGCLAAGIYLVRRFDVRALPAVGVLCSFCGFCFGVEYGVFSSLPIYAIVSAYAYKREQWWRWLAYAFVGLVLVPAAGAYFVLPTLSVHMFTDSAARTATLVDSTFTAYYSEGLVQYLALIPTEALLSPSTMYNATGQLPIALLGGICLWVFALIGFLRYRFDYSRGEFGIVAIAVVGVLIVMSAAALIPGANIIWKLVASVPIVNAIRTPDRFITLPVLAVTVLAFDGLRICTKELAQQKVLASLILTAVLGSFFYVAGTQQVWSNQQDYGSEEPALASTNALVASIGPRTVPFAFLNGGSTGDYPSYGVPTPTFSGYWDFAARYLLDGTAMTGILSRTSVKTVITTPTWATSDSDGLPDFGRVFAQADGAKQIVRSAEGVRVFTLKADPIAKATHVACLSGGPGLLDRLLAWPLLDNVDLTGPDGNCAFTIVTDSAADDAGVATAQWAVAGSGLCTTCSILRDADYDFYPGRAVLNLSWYRNSIDGDSPVFGRQGAIRIPDETMILLPAMRTERGSQIALRLASHAYATVVARCGSGETAIRVLPFNGFRWFTMTLQKPLSRCGRIQLTFFVDSTQPANISTFSGEIALDGAIVPGSARRPETSARSGSDIYTFTAGHLVRDDATPYSGQIVLGNNAVRWNGPSENVAVVADLSAFPGARKNARLAEEIFLRHGQFIIAPSTRNSYRNTHIRKLTAVKATGRIALFSDGAGLVSGDVDFQAGASALAQTSGFSRFPNSALSRNGLTGRNGDTLTMQIPAVAGSSSIVAGFFGVEGDGYADAMMRCNGAQKSLRVSQNVDAGLVLSDNDSPCTLRIVWHGKSLTIRRLFFNVQRRNFDGERNVWLASGSYRVYVLSPRNRALATNAISIDGRRVPSMNTIYVARSGPHTMTLTRMPAQSALVALVPAAFSYPSAGAISLEQTDAIRYEVAVPKRTDLKLAHLDDGNWALDGATKTMFGERCDLVSTCYRDVPPGRYRIFHRLPQAVRIGFAITILGSIVALLCLWVPGQPFFGERE